MSATCAPRAKIKFAIAAKFLELLKSIPYNDQLAYLCYITREGDVEAVRIAKEKGILTKANVGGVLVRLLRHLVNNRGGYEDLLVEGGIEGSKYRDMAAEEQRRFDTLVEWLIRGFEFTPEAARKIVDSRDAPAPLPLLAAQAAAPRRRRVNCFVLGYERLPRKG